MRTSESIDSSIKPSDECQTYSDHQHRWAAGLPAVLITDSTEYYGYPSYHEPCQTVNKINASCVRSMMQLTVAPTALLVAPQS